MTGFVTVTGFDLVMIYVSGVLAAIAGTVNVHLMLSGPTRLRPLFGAIAALSYSYVAAYIVLVAGPWSQQDWTRAARGMAVVAWLLVWTWMPWQFCRLARRSSAVIAVKKVEAAQQILEQVASSLGVELEEADG